MWCQQLFLFSCDGVGDDFLFFFPCGGFPGDGGAVDKDGGGGWCHVARSVAVLSDEVVKGLGTEAVVDAFRDANFCGDVRQLLIGETLGVFLGLFVEQRFCEGEGFVGVLVGNTHGGRCGSGRVLGSSGGSVEVRDGHVVKFHVASVHKFLDGGEELLLELFAAGAHVVGVHGDIHDGGALSDAEGTCLGRHVAW